MLLYFFKVTHTTQPRVYRSRCEHLTQVMPACHFQRERNRKRKGEGRRGKEEEGGRERGGRREGGGKRERYHVLLDAIHLSLCYLSLWPPLFSILCGLTYLLKHHLALLLVGFWDRVTLDV